MSGTLQFDNTEVFTNPGIGTPFIEITSAPGVTGHRLYTEGSNLFIRDTFNNSTIFGTAGATGATGPRGLQGNPGIGINGQNGISGGSILILDSPSGSAPQSGDLIQIPGVTKTITSTASSGDVLMGTFTTPQNSTTSLLIISGIWRLNIFATTLSQLVRIYFSVYYTDSTGVSETLIVDGSSASATLIGTSLQQYMCSVYFPETSLPYMSSRIRIKVFATFLGSDTITVNLGGNTVSYLNTTIQANTVPFNFTGEGQLMYISSSTVVGVPEMTYTKLTSTTNFRNLLIYNSTVGNAAWFSTLTVSSILATSMIANYISSLLLETNVFVGSQMTTSSIVANNVSTLSLQTGLFVTNSLTTSSITANNLSTLFGQIGVFVGSQLTTSSIVANNISTLSLQTGRFTTSSIVANNISSISGQVGGLTVSTIRVGAQANNNFVFFSKNNTPYYSNTTSSFSLVGENLSNVFYVAKNGDDILGDGSQMRPFLTISTAVGQAPANAYCAVYVSPGIYEEYVVVTNPSLSMYGTTRGSKFNQGAIIDGSLTIMNNSTSPTAVANAVCEYAGLHINQRATNTSTSLITIRDYAVSTSVFQVNFASMLITSENINAHGLLISSFSIGPGSTLTRVNIQNSRFSLESVSSAIGLKGGMLWEMNDNYVQNTGSGSALEIVGGRGQILDIRNNTLSADTGSALTIDKLFSSFNYGFRRNIITANTAGGTVSMTSNNGYTYFVKFPVPFTDNYIANTKVDTGGNSLFAMTGSDNFINLTQNELLLSMPKALFTFNPAYVVSGNTSNTIFHRNNTLAAPNPDSLLSTVGTYSPGMSTIMNPLFLDFIGPQLFISSLTTNNISSLRGQIGAFTVSSIVANNISSLRLQTSSIVANNISSLSLQTSSIVANNISSLRLQTSSIVANNISSLSLQTSSIVANNISSLRLQTSSIVANNISTLTEQVGTLTATAITASTINVSTINQTAPIGNTLTVDAVFGNDTLAAQNRYTMPFSTIAAALALATSGQNVIVRPGTYNETLIMPDGVSVTGAGTQCVIIQKLNVTSNTTLITMSTNNRFENFTANLTTATNGVDLIGCYLPSRATTTSKIRQSVWNISTATTSPATVTSTIAMYSPGITANPSTFSSPNIIQRTTLNVATGNSGLCRGIYVNGPNRFAVRDMVVNARGISSIGIETADPNAFADVKTTSVYGEALDIFRSQGNLELGFTNLQNGTCGPSSFSVVSEPSIATFGIIGNLGDDAEYNLIPGVISLALAPATPFEIPITQNLIIFAGTIISSTTLGAGISIVFNIYKLIGGVAPAILVYTLSLLEGQKQNVNIQSSVNFRQGDTYYATLTTVNNPISNTYTITLAFY